MPDAQKAQESHAGESEPRKPVQWVRELAAIEEKWAVRWQEARVYEADPEPGREKFFATYPYSYMNAFAHVGHAYTMLRTDLKVRHERARGRNTLYPFGFHVTGTPIVAAAARIAKKDPQQIKILVDSGIPEDQVERFKDPQYWIDFFPDQWKSDVSRFALAVDWRRSFITTQLNPYYDRFIRWQFLRLKEGGYVRTGRHPVVWDPVEKAVVGDHDRTQGEGVAPQEAVLLKFPIQGEEDRFLIAATLRPETVFGQTNLWVNPRVSYQEIQVDQDGKKERWIVSVECADKLKLQDVGVDPDTTYEHVSGSDLVGKRVRAPGVGRWVPVLPALFPTTERWTGIVTSVPSDAPLDHVALTELKADPSPLVQCGADASLLDDVEPIEIIETEELGRLPAQTVNKKLGIESQTQKKELEQATEEVYQAGFYKGAMLAHCKGDDGKDFGSLTVAEAKEAVKPWLLERGEAGLMYEPEGKVVTRHGNEAVVKIVSDQWFLAYGDPDWKDTVHKALDEMKITPEIARKQYHIVVDWLNDWACARETGLGTRLPWDEKWVIESLSDSTIYMAYYTVHHHLKRLEPDPEALTPAFWDHVLLGKGTAQEVATGGLQAQDVKRMREEFLYWYPLDFRNSGKDLLQNHLTFAVFNHTAIFAPEHWPREYAVNGWVTIDGEKMSKSQGNFITLREAMDRFGVSATRFAVANAGEGLDDANFEVDLAKSVSRRLYHWLDSLKTIWDEAVGPDGAGDPRLADRWFLSRLNRAVRDTDAAMERAEYRSALKGAFFDLERDWDWYVRRTAGRPDPQVAREHVLAQVHLTAVFVPHLAEELWEHVGGEGFVVNARYPRVEGEYIDDAVERAEAYVVDVRDDVRNILRMLRQEPQAIRLFTAPAWKRRVDEAVAQEWRDVDDSGQVQQGQITKGLMEDEEIRRLGKPVPQYVGKVIKQGRGFLAAHEQRAGVDEHKALEEAANFLSAEFGCEVIVQSADDDALDDPGKKANAAVPGRPAIHVS